MLVIHFSSFLLPGGFYTDQLAFVNDSCLHCENGTFVHYNNAPGKSPIDCRACPQGDYLKSPLLPGKLKSVIDHFRYSKIHTWLRGLGE